MRLERRRPRLHECEARKGSRDLRPAKFDVAEKRDVAGGDACVPVASAGQTDIENTSLDSRPGNFLAAIGPTTDITELYPVVAR